MKITMMVPEDLGTRSGGYLYDRKLREHLVDGGDEVETITIFEHNCEEGSHDLIEAVWRTEPDLIFQDELAYQDLKDFNTGIRGIMNVPVVSIIHNLSTVLIKERKKRSETLYLERSYLITVDALVVNSMTTMKDMTDVTGVKKPYIIANPGKDHIDLKTEVPERDSDKVRILAVGNLNRNKGFLRMLSALSRMRSMRWILRIAGNMGSDPDYVRSLENKIQELDFTDRVEMLGHLDDRGLRRAYLDSDIYISTSAYEGWGISNVEAMGAGLPLVVSHAGAVEEYIEDGVQGYLVDPMDVEHIATKIEDLVIDPDLRKKMGERARKRYDDLPTWKESMEKVREFIHDLVREN